MSEPIKKRLMQLYGIEVLEVKKVSMGVGSESYIVIGKEQKYLAKYSEENNMNHPELEPDLCRFLCEHGIPACRMVSNLQGSLLSHDENGRQFHVQKFIEGKVYQYHEASEWLMKESAQMLGKIHKQLASYEDLPEGIGEKFFKFTSVKQTIVSYENTIKKARYNGEVFILERIDRNLEVMKNLPAYSFDLTKLTICNTHGDYNVTQLICGEEKINAVIDWTCACRHPVVWELMRSYVFSSSKCKDGVIDVSDFAEYIKEYLKFGSLNTYDLQNMGPLFTYFLAVCNFFGQYEDSTAVNREVFLKQAMLSSKLLEWLFENVDILTEKLKSL